MMSICDDLKWGRVSEITSNMCVSYVSLCLIFDKLELEIWPILHAILECATYDTMENVWLSGASEYDGNNVIKYIYVTVLMYM
jgi:hypothetical protein